MCEFWREKKINGKKIPKIFQKNFFLLFFGLKSRNGGEIHEFEAWKNHEIAGITNFEITKSGDSLYLQRFGSKIVKILRCYCHDLGQSERNIFDFSLCACPHKREPLEILTRTKLILNDQRGHSGSFQINFKSFRTFRGFLFYKQIFERYFFWKQSTYQGCIHRGDQCDHGCT